MENETDEQFEERVLNKRAAQVFNSVKSKLLPLDKLLFTEITIRHNRKQVGGLIPRNVLPQNYRIQFGFRLHKSFTACWYWKSSRP